MWLVALPVCAGTIDVTGLTQVTLGPGDALAFTFSASSYLAHAAQYQAPAYPTGIDFLFATADLVSAGDITVELESADGLTSVAFDDVAVSSGWVHGALYNGATEIVWGSLDLAPGMADAIFSGPAVLVLSSAASGVTVGLPPYRLARSMVVSLSGGGLGVGGVLYGVSLESAPTRCGAAGAARFCATDDPPGDGPQNVPEPNSGLLLAGGGVLLLALGAALKRLRRSRI